MSGEAAPKQGDHVFNALDTAILGPFDTIRSFRSSVLDGQQFIHDYLLHSYSMAKQVAATLSISRARDFVASPGSEEDALRELTKLRSRNPSLARITGPLLRDIHLRNSKLFGAAAARFEVEFLGALQKALETAVDPTAVTADPGRKHSPGIAVQQMLDAGYDPAAALIVVTNSMVRENAPLQGPMQNVIVGIADTLDRPAMWKDPYSKFREDRRTETGAVIAGIRDALMRLDAVKAPSVTFANWVREEIAKKAHSPDTDSDFGAMIHLVHARLQQTR